MFCPQCCVEYRDGFVECADCHVPLTAQLPPPETSAEGHEGEGDLDVLIRTGCWNPIAVGLARSLLQEAGVPFFVMDQTSAASQEGGNFLSWLDIRVPHDREAEAREILRSVEEMK